jgi:hypothetical protein
MFLGRIEKSGHWRATNLRRRPRFADAYTPPDSFCFATDATYIATGTTTFPPLD